MSYKSFSEFLTTEAAKSALQERAEKHGVSVEVLYEVFDRGVLAWEEDSNKTIQQYAFNRVDSFLNGGLASQLDRDLLDEGKRINSKVEYHVVHKDTKSVLEKHTQLEKALHHAKRVKHIVHVVDNDRVVKRLDHNGRKIDAKGYIVEGKHYLKARMALHDAHHEVSRRLAGSERDPELRRTDLHRAKKHKHASQVLEVLKTTVKRRRKKK